MAQRIMWSPGDAADAWLSAPSSRDADFANRCRNPGDIGRAGLSFDWFTCVRTLGVIAAVATELLVALDIPSILFGAIVMSDILFQAVVAAGIVLSMWMVSRGCSDRMAVAGILFA